MHRRARLRHRRRGLLLAVFGLAAITPAMAEAPAGAAACSGCHSQAGPVPPLEGRPAETIVADMQAFRSGARAATVMDRIAKGFTDEETRAIGEWLAAAGASGPPAEP